MNLAVYEWRKLFRLPPCGPFWPCVWPLTAAVSHALPL